MTIRPLLFCSIAQIIALTIAVPALAAPEAADPAAGQRFTEQCKGKETFDDPAPPVRIYGNVWYVGTCNVTVLLLTSPKGHVLVDSATAEAAPQIIANIRTAGFDPKDVRWIVSSHEHFDHVGGLALMKKATGAKVVARDEAAATFRSGKVSPADPQVQEIHGFDPVKPDRVMKAGQTLRAGPLRLTMLATPGHTEGSTSWTWQSCAGDDCRKFTYLDSISALQLGTYRFSANPERVTMFRQTFEAIDKMDCGIVLTPHPGVSAMAQRMAGTEPLYEEEDCRVIVKSARARLDTALLP
ncbi:MAG: subclass B3 metallo-beta-lactamase [Novosphingobium sp.]|jgi:metallo-beta-lactamase class B|nr:subclass B3 metallo-beta-lactamase [Novosphingobium sp.]